MSRSKDCLKADLRGAATDESVEDVFKDEAEGLEAAALGAFPVDLCPVRFSRVPDPAGLLSHRNRTSFGPFVDLLLTRGGERKKPRWIARRKALMLLEDFGCGGRI